MNKKPPYRISILLTSLVTLTLFIFGIIVYTSADGTDNEIVFLPIAFREEAAAPPIDSTPPPETSPFPSTPTQLPTLETPVFNCPVSFVQPPLHEKKSVLVTGEIGATIEVWDISSIPEKLLGTTVLLAQSGYHCDGFADFVPPAHPPLNSLLFSGQFIEVRQYIDGNLHSTDIEIVLFPTPTPTVTNTPTPTTQSFCAVNFVQPPVHGQTSALITGEIGATIEVWDLSTTPETLLGTTILLDRPGYLCDGFADFVPATHPALSPPLISGHLIEVRQFINGNLHSTDVEFVLEPVPTSTPTPTSTPSGPFVILLPTCGGANQNGNSLTITFLGFDFEADQNISIFWDTTQFQTTILAANHDGNFSYTFTVHNVDPGTYFVRAISDSADLSQPYRVPCDNFEPTPVTSTPTYTPSAPELIVIGPPQLVSSAPISAFTSVDFNVLISNTGGTDIDGQFFVDLYVNPSEVYDSHIPIEQSSGYTAVSSLGSGEGKLVTINVPLGFDNSPATNMVYAMVDSAGTVGTGQVFEENELNNISEPASVTGIIPANTPTPTPTVDPSGIHLIAGTVNSRVIEWRTQFRAIVSLIDSNGEIFAITDSDEFGYYEFPDVVDDTYTVYACINIDEVSYFGVRLGIVPPNPVTNIYMLPGECGVSGSSNQPPTIIHPGDQLNLEEDEVSLFIEADDPEEATLTYSAVGLPPGLSMNPTSGEIYGTISSGFAGEYPTSITVDDGENQTNILFTWHVLANELRFESFIITGANSSA